MLSQQSDMSGGEEFLIPLAFDPTPSPMRSPPTLTQQTAGMANALPRDYFGASGAAPATKISTETPPMKERGHRPSNENFDSVRRKENAGSAQGSTAASPQINSDRSRPKPPESPNTVQASQDTTARGEKFKLQEAPKARRSAGSRPSSTARGLTLDNSHEDAAVESWRDNSGPQTPLARDPDSMASGRAASPKPSTEYQHYMSGEESPSSLYPVGGQLQTLPKRGDSLEGNKAGRAIPRKELPGSSLVSAAPTPSKSHDDSTKMNGGKVISKPMESPLSKSIFDAPNTIQKRGEPGTGESASEAFVASRPPPQRPREGARSRNDSVGTAQEPSTSPALPRWSSGGEFSMEEDMARILGGDEAGPPGSFLRRVSNSVRHGRSFSDKTLRLSKDNRWARSPMTAASGATQDISSPSTASPEHRDELSWLRNELRRERQRIVEREQRIAELEAALNSAANIKQVNTELREKRTTMVVLDTQKEIVVRELEVLTDHIAAAKKSGDPLDFSKMKNAVLRDFAEALQRLKESFAPQIEDSIQKRNDLVAEIANLTKMKDKSFQEFEQLSLKNAQLAELNNQLVHQIQQLYKANSGPSAASGADVGRQTPNGLGIYSHHKDKSQVSIDSREVKSHVADGPAGSGTTLAQDDTEAAAVVQGPHVVNIRKGQVRKFNWKKGGQNVAKGVTKGLKGAFSSTQQNYSRELQASESAPNSSLQPGLEYANIPKSNNEPVRQGFGIFGNSKPTAKANGTWRSPANGSASALPLDASSCMSYLSAPRTKADFLGLYGSDLEQRAEFERLDIPAIVTRCVQEVEMRGECSPTARFVNVLIVLRRH